MKKVLARHQSFQRMDTEDHMLVLLKHAANSLVVSKSMIYMKGLEFLAKQLGYSSWKKFRQELVLMDANKLQSTFTDVRLLVGKHSVLNGGALSLREQVYQAQQEMKRWPASKIATALLEGGT